MKKMFGIAVILPLYFASIFLACAQSNEEVPTHNEMALAEVSEVDEPTKIDVHVSGIFEVLKAESSLTTFVTALKASGLADKLSSGAYTILAPSNEAFDALPKGTLEELLMPENKEKLISVLQNHIFTGAVSADQIGKVENLSSWSGQDVPVNVGSAGVFFGEAKVEKADLKTDHGMVHIISQVII